MKIPKIDYQPDEDLTDLFERNRDIVFDRFFDCIKFGLDNDIEDVIVFELGETGFYLEANIQEWAVSLDSCIFYYSMLENYEKCMDCKKLKYEVEQRTKK